MTGFVRRTPVKLLPQTRVKTTGNSDAVEAFLNADAVTVTVNVKQSNAVPRGSIALIVEHSADGSSWATLATVGTVTERTESIDVTADQPDAFLRLSWTVTGAAVWYVDAMAVTFEDYSPGLGGGDVIVVGVPTTRTITAGDGLTGGGTLAADRTISVAEEGITDEMVAASNKDGNSATPSLRTLGSGTTQAVAGDDTRLSNARTPTAHANTHKTGGTDGIRLDELAVPTGPVAFNNQRLTGVAAPTDANDAVTKAYADALSAGLDVKLSVVAATTANIALSGEQTIDGVSVVAGDRVLVKNQTTGSQNGIYVAAVGAWARSSDADTSPEVTAGMFTFVESGSVQSDQGWVLATPDPITLDTTALVFTQFSGIGGSPTGSAGGALAGTFPNPTIAANAVTSAEIATGAVGASEIADASITDTEIATANKDGAAGTPSLRTLGTGSAQAAAGNDSRLSDSRAPTGSAGGVLSGTFPNPGFAADMATQAELDAVSAAGIPKTLIDAKGDLIAGSAADTAARVAKGAQGYYLFSDSAQTAGLGWGHPLDAIDVVREGGLVDDASTDCSAALQALCDAVSISTGNGRHAYLIFPFTNIGRYKLNTVINTGPKALHFVGHGMTYNTTQCMTTLIAGTNGMTMFAATTDGTFYQQGPCFENLCLIGASVTGATGLAITGVNRVRIKDCVFLSLATAGVTMAESTTDCAWHHLDNVGFYSCGTGLLDNSSNNWFGRGLVALNNTIGIDLHGANIAIDGIFVQPSANNQIGVRIGGSGNSVTGIMWESGNGSTGPRTCVQINGDGTSTKGAGNYVQIASAHGGSGVGNTNVGIDITSGANDNTYAVNWSTGFSAGKTVQDAGSRNRGVGSYRRPDVFPNGMSTLGSAGAVSDAAFLASSVPNQTIAIDTTNKRLFAKIGGAWYQTQLTLYVPPLMANTFEGGTNTTTITTGNSGAGSGNAFDVVTNGGALTFDNAHVYDTLAAKIVTTTAAQVSFGWTTSLGGSGVDHYGRFYLYRTANPAAALRLMIAANATLTVAGIRLGTDGKLSLIDGAGTIFAKSGGGSATSTNAISLNQFVRIEYHFHHSASAGMCELKLFNSPDSGTATETLTTTSVMDTGAGFDEVRLGVTSALASETFWIENWTANAASYPGHV